MAGVMGGFLAGSIVAKMLLDKTGWNSSVSSVKGDVKELGQKTGGLAGIVNSMATAWTLGGAAVVGTLSAIVIKTAEYGDKLWELHLKTGASVETLSGLKLAADESGTSMEGLATGFRKLGMGIDEAQKGTGKAADAFNQLKIEIKDNQGGLRRMDDVMLDVADRFSKMEDGAGKVALAIDLFGRSGMELIPFLNEGRDGIEKLTAKAKELGLVIDEKTAAAGDKFNDTLTELKGAAQGVTMELGNALIPVLTDVAKGATDLVTGFRKWLEQNPWLIESITSTVEQVFKLVGNLGDLIGKVIELTNWLPSLINALSGLDIKLSDVSGAGLKFTNMILEAIKDTDNWKNGLAPTAEEFAKVDAAMKGAADTGKGLTQSLSDITRPLTLTREQMEGYEQILRTITGQKKIFIDITDKATKAVDKYRLGLTALAIPIMTATQLQWNLDEGMKQVVLDMNARAIPAIDNTKTSLMSLAMSLDMGDAFNKLGADSQKTTNAVESGWESLYSDLATGWGNLIGEFLAGGVTLNKFLSNIWDETKKAFFRVIGEMISKWLINLIKKMVDSAIEGAVSIGSTFVGIITSLGTVITTLATGIATAIVTLATAIATAATILAAAAVPLLIVGGIAAAIYAGFSLISAIFGGGGGGNDDITFWLKPISESSRQTADWLRISFMEYVGFWNSLFISDNFCLYELHGRLVETRDAVSYWGQAICDSIGKIKGAQHGYISTTHELIAVHGTPSIPEITLPEPIYERNLQMAAAMGGGQPSGPVEIYIDRIPLQFPFEQNVRKVIIEEMPKLTANQQVIIWDRSVKAYGRG